MTETQTHYSLPMAREAADLRDLYSGVLHGDWAIYEAAHRWCGENHYA